MAEHPDAALIRAGYEAFDRGDLEAVAAGWSDEIVWHEQTGTWVLTGDYVGKPAVLEFMAAMQAHGLTAMSIEIHDLLASDDHVVGLVTVHAEHGEHKIANYKVHIWHVSGGRAAEAWLLSLNPAAFDAFWAA